MENSDTDDSYNGYVEDLDNLDTSDLEDFLHKNLIRFDRKYSRDPRYKENNRIRYNLHQVFDAGRYYTVDIDYYGLVTFEYESEKYGFVSTSIFEECGGWNNIKDKHILFKRIIKHMSSYIDSDYSYESDENNDE